MLQDKKILIKKFIHENALVFGASVLLLAILAILLLNRQLSLTSIRDLSSINPLITSSQNELVVVGESNRIAKVPTDDGLSEQTNIASGSKSSGTSGGSKSTSSSSSSGGTTTNSGTGTKSSSSSSSGSTGGTTQTSGSTGGGTGGSTSPGTGGGGATPTPTPTQAPPPQAPFSVSIGQAVHVVSGKGSIVGPCKLMHDFEVNISGSNGPGTVSYYWVRSDGVISSMQQLSFLSGSTSKKVSYSWEITSSSGSRYITLKITSPSTQEKKISFEHNCRGV